MASAIPGGAPGYDDDKEFGNNITHMAAQTSQRLRGYSCQGPEVKGGRRGARFGEISGVPAVRRVRICCTDAKCRISGQRYGPATPSPPPAIPTRTPAA